ncbi:hypothetical protein GQR58_024081 [Nymphon striatum]|nr:hypothetical protein GQR58_024081 [Nymphon striatum]
MICHVVSIVSGSKALSMIVEYKKIADASLHEEGSAIRLSKVACTTQSEHAAKNTVFEFSKLCSSKHGQWTEKQTKTNIISMFMRKSVLVIVATFNRFYYKSSRWILYFAQAIVLFASYFMLIETSEHSTMKSFYWMTTHVISYSTVIISLSSFCIIIESLRTTLYLGCTVDLNSEILQFLGQKNHFRSQSSCLPSYRITIPSDLYTTGYVTRSCSC